MEKKPLVGKRVLIVGISGYLGSAFALGLRDDYEVFGTYRHNPVRIEGCTAVRMDANNGGEILEVLQNFSPDVVLYCAGARNIKECEELPAFADAVNFKAPSIFFKVLKNNTHFVYFSESRTFDDRTGKAFAAIPETSTPSTSPGSSAFAKSKIQGENVVRTHGRRTHVLRLGTLFGDNLGAPLNVKYNWLARSLEQIARGHPQPFIHEASRGFVYIGDVVRALRLFLKSIPDISQVFHLSDYKNPMSYYQLASLAGQQWELDKTLFHATKYNPKGHLHEWGPETCVLSGEKFENTYNFKFQNPAQALQEMSERYRTGLSGTWV